MSKYPHVLWVAEYGKRKAYITLQQSMTGQLPSWIHEYGNQVKWKILEGKEHLYDRRIKKIHR